MKLSNKSEFVKRYASYREIKKSEAEKEVDAFLSVLVSTCVEGGVSFNDLFKIEVAEKPAREGKCCGREYSTPASKKFSFKAFKGLLDALNY